MNSAADQLERQSDDIAEKDIPLREDIRQLGRLLGNTVRAQEGQLIFDLVENIRQLSIRFHRDDDIEARRELEEILQTLTQGRCQLNDLQAQRSCSGSIQAATTARHSSMAAVRNSRRVRREMR